MPARIDAGRGGVRAASTGGVTIRGRAGDAAGLIGATLSNFADGQIGQIREARAQDQLDADKINIAKAGSAARLDWQSRMTEALDGYDGGTPGFTEDVTKQFREDANARLKALDPRIRRDVEQDFVQLGERLTSAALAGERGKRQAYVMRGLRETLDTEATRLLDAPDDLGGALDGVDRLADAAPEGLRDDFREEARTNLASAYIDGLMGKDASRLHYELEAGMLDSVLDAKEKSRIQTIVAGEVSRQAAAAERAQEAAVKERLGTAKELVARVVAYENAGLAAPPELLQQAQDASVAASDAGLLEKMSLASYKRRTKGSGKTTTAKHALDVLEKTLAAGLSPSPDMIAGAQSEVVASGSEDLYKRLQGIAETQALRQEAAFMPRADLDARLKELRSGEVDEAGLREFNVLSKVAQRREVMGKTDNVGWAEANGAAFAPVDLSSPSLTGDVAQRLVQADALAEATGEKLQLFSKRERGQLVDQLDAMEPVAQAETLARLTLGAGGRSGQLVRELAEKRPALAQIGYLTATGRGDVAVQALKGQQLLKSQPGLLPKTKGTLADIEKRALGGAIPQARDDVRTALVDTARAIYAAQLAQAGQGAEDFDDDDYEAALQAAAGRQGAKGGIGRVNGASVQLPAHMAAGEVEGLLKGMSVEDWTAFSLSGASAPAGLSDAGDGLQPLDPGALKRTFLISVGEGRYQVSLTDPKFGAQYLLDSLSVPENPRPYVLDLTQVNPGAVGQRMALDAARARSQSPQLPMDKANADARATYQRLMSGEGQ